MSERKSPRCDLAAENKILRQRVAELEQAQAALQARLTEIDEQRFRDLVEGSIQGIMIQRDGNALFVNEAFARIFGYDSPADILRLESLNVLVHPDEWTRMRDFAARRLRGEAVPERYLSKGVKPDGSVTYLDTLVRVVDWDGEPAIQSTVVDVTERELANEAVQISEQRFRSLLEHSPSLIVLKDRKGRYLYVNPRHEEWHGISAEQMEGKTAREIHPKAFAERLLVHDRRVLETGRVVQEIFKTERPDGSELIQNSTKFPMRDARGEIIGIGVIATDVTEQKRAEEAVRASEARFKNVFDHSPSLILLKDLEGRYILVNDRHEDIYGIPGSELIGKTAHDIYSDENADDFVRRDRIVQEQGRSMSWEYDLIRPDGIAITMINTKFPVRNGQGDIVGIGTIATDVSEVRRLESQLRESQKLEAVGQLAGGIAHDFNNLLQIINGYAQLASSPTREEATRTRYLRQIIEAGERAANLTRQLLTYSRKTQMKEQPVDLNRLIRNLLDMVGRIIGEDIELSFTPGEELRPVLADPGMLDQVVVNLCVNARDAMPHGGRLMLATGRRIADQALCDQLGLPAPGEYVVMTVADTGAGMTSSVRGRIFEPFYTTKDVGKGTGLGLSMAHSIVLQHGGMIDVATEPGQGTTFAIYLPATDAPLQPEALPANRDTRRGNETILVAEDEMGVRELLADLLAAQGYRVLTAADGQEAVECFRSHSAEIDLVILDVVMPRLKGPEVHDFIRSVRPEVPVLFSTGYSDRIVSADYLARNAITVIRKPYRPDALLDTVRETLDRR